MLEYSTVFASPVAKIGIVVRQGSLIGVNFLCRDTVLKKPQDALSREVVCQLQSYFSEPAFCFDLPLNIRGTVFQRTVWGSLRGIRAGETRAYGELAAQLDTGARAVGNACSQNPLPLIIPCHRVVSVSGIGGYAGHTQGKVLERKRWLLAHEGVRIA